LGEGPSATSTPEVQVYGADGVRRTSFEAYPATVSFGVRLAVGNVLGDGRAEIVTTPGPGDAGADVRIFDGTGSPLGGFTAFDGGFGGGASVATGDVDGDGREELVVAPGAVPLNPPYVRR